MGVVYALLEPRGGAVRYIGKTSGMLKKRFSGHLSSADSRLHPVSRWIKGLSNNNEIPICKKLAEVENDCLDGFEKNLIKHYGRFCNLLNVSDVRIRERFDRKMPTTQYDLSGKKIGEYESMMEASRETGSKKSSVIGSCKGTSYICNGFIFKYKGDNLTKKEIDYRISKTVKPIKAVLQQDMLGKALAEWSSGSKAARDLGISKCLIYECCRGNKKSYKGYLWGYKEDMNNSKNKTQ